MTPDPQLASSGRQWRIGYLTELQYCPATPGVKRVLTQTVQALEAAGHQLVPFQLEYGQREAEIYMQTVQPENGVFMLRGV